MNSHETEFAIRSQIKNTWPVFFGQFGRLTAVQVAAIPVVLSGKSAIISSATASGKTESVISPIAELMIQRKSRGKLSVVYVSPTRALVNDMHERLAKKLEQLGFATGVWTSDHHTFHPRSPSEFLLLTPESLDSAISRHPESFSTVEFCILDELHLVDGTARGDQLSVLCRRLQDRCEQIVKFYALSATLRNSQLKVFSYFKPDEVVSVSGSREIRYRLFPAGPNSIKGVLGEFRKNGLKKALFFCNSRKDTEILAQELKKEVQPECVFVHHGSLPKDSRELAEASLRSLPFLFCACTSTLEVGIDIGDVDAIVLNGCPPSVSSLLQRIGRGNRRISYTLAFGLFESQNEQLMFEDVFSRAMKGELEDVSHDPCLSVAVQQTLSLLFQNRNNGIGIADLKGLMDLFDLTDIQWTELINHLRQEGYLEELRAKLYPSQKLLDLADKGRIHSNISSSAAFKVVSLRTGQVLGEIGYLDAHSGTLMLAGRYWKVGKVDERTVYVEPRTSTIATTPTFPRRRNRGAFYGLLPRSLMALSKC